MMLSYITLASASAVAAALMICRSRAAELPEEPVGSVVLLLQAASKLDAATPAPTAPSADMNRRRLATAVVRECKSVRSRRSAIRMILREVRERASRCPPPLGITRGLVPVTPLRRPARDWICGVERNSHPAGDSLIDGGHRSDRPVSP